MKRFSALVKSMFLLTKRLENTILLTFKWPKLQGKHGILCRTIDQRRISWWCRRVIGCSETFHRKHNLRGCESKAVQNVWIEYFSAN